MKINDDYGLAGYDDHVLAQELLRRHEVGIIVLDDVDGTEPTLYVSRSDMLELVGLLEVSKISIIAVGIPPAGQ